MLVLKKTVLLQFILLILFKLSPAQSWDLTLSNIDRAIKDSSKNIMKDTLRPVFHLTPPAGSMGDPNGGIYSGGWYHMFYGLQPFSGQPGGWYWAHAKSRDLVNWVHMKNELTPAFELGLNAVGSGSTIISSYGQKLAFYSQSLKGPMHFWRAEFTDPDFTAWSHQGKNPVLTLDHPGLPLFDDFWRDPFVFRVDGRTFLIACADLFEEDYVPVPIFEAMDEELTDWEYKGNLFTVPKHKYRNLEVPEFRQLGDKWIFMASTDAPVDRTNYFIGEFDIENLRFILEAEGPIDYSGHFYAQESIQDDNGDLYLMAWIPGWDRPWLPQYMNEPLKNSDPLWNGCFSLPRKLSIESGQLMQQPVDGLKQIRGESFSLEPMELPVKGPTTAYHLMEGFTGNQYELKLEMKLQHASFCGLNLLCDNKGKGGLFIVWYGDILNVDGVEVPIKEWSKGESLSLQIFVDRKFVEVFVNGGRYSITRMVKEQNIGGNHIALSSLGGTARLNSLRAWRLKGIN